METKVYHMVPGMGLEEAKPTPNLPLYSRVYAYGGAMADYVYAVISEPDENGMQQLVKMTTNSEGDYFGPFQKLERYAKPHSKKFGIGFYWDDQNPEFRFSKEQVDEAIFNGQVAIAKAEQKAKEQAEKDRKEIESLPKLFPHLTPLKDSHDKNGTKKNLVADLKKNFPEVKFSVRKEHYSTYCIRWTDGPTVDQVKKVTGKYEDHESDWSGDYWDYSPSNFNHVFGGFKFVSEVREFSGEKEQLREQLTQITTFATEQDCAECFYRLLRKTSFPANAKNFTIERTNISCGAREDFYRIVYDAPEQKKPEAQKTQTTAAGLEIIDYSAKAIAVTGNTKPIKDQLKAIGGKFNFRLKCGAGWIFPKTKQDEVTELLKSLA